MKDNKKGKIIIGAFITLIIFACTNIKQESAENSLCIKVFSPTNCSYTFLLKRDSLCIESKNYLFDTLAQIYDSVVINKQFLLDANNKIDVQNFKEFLLKTDSKIEKINTQDLHTYEVFMKDSLVRKAICCDDSIIVFLQKVVLPKIDENIYCNQFFEIIKTIK